MTWPFGQLKPAHYRLILLDPPWKFIGGTKGRPQHYARMTLAEIAAMPIRELAHPDGAWVAVWCTSPQTRNMFKINEGWTAKNGTIIPGWGARFSGRGFVWIKTSKKNAKLSSKALFMHQEDFHFGQGYTTRKNAEDLWLFKFGKPKRLSKKVREPIFEPVREHSRKPQEAMDRLCQFADGPRCELFSRETDPRFEPFGFEVGKFDQCRAA